MRYEAILGVVSSEIAGSRIAAYCIRFSDLTD